MVGARGIIRISFSHPTDRTAHSRTGPIDATGLGVAFPARRLRSPAPIGLRPATPAVACHDGLRSPAVACDRLLSKGACSTPPTNLLAFFPACLCPFLLSSLLLRRWDWCLFLGAFHTLKGSSSFFFSLSLLFSLFSLSFFSVLGLGVRRRLV